MLLGIISDTHGLMRPEVPAALAGVELIIHAGDVGTMAVLEALRAIAPTVAIRGNVDTAPPFTALPETTVVKAGEIELYVVHDLAMLSIDPVAAGYRAVIYGHSHKPAIEERRGGVLYLNPGAAGPRRFKLTPSLVRLEVHGRDLRPSLVPL
jgi:putative phosphoesterase